MFLVGDDRAFSAWLEPVLRRLGFDVLGVVSTGDAPALAESVTPPSDLVLLDLDAGGAAAAAGVFRSRDVDLILIGAAESAGQLPVHDVSPLAFIRKPVSEAELAVQLEAAVRLRAAERLLGHDEPLLLALSRLVSQAVIVVDPDGRVAHLNAGAEQLTHWSAGDAKGRPVDEVFAVADAMHRRLEAPTARAARQQSAGRSKEPELLIRRDRTTIPVTWRTELVDPRDGDGRVLLAFEAAAAEATSAPAVKALEDDLHQAQKMAAIGRLAAGVAHDFSTVLTIVSGSAELALEIRGVSPDVRKHLEEIVSATRRGASLTRQLLAFGRRQPLQPAVIHVNDVVHAAERLLSPLLGTDVQVALDLAPRLPPVFVDPDQLEIVILNLATNARDAMSAGGRLTIATRDQPISGSDDVMVGVPPGRYASIAVSDTGHGMDATTIARAFEPFFTTKLIGKGTGLGLASVYGTIKQSGGFIFAASTPGSGTTFTILLPVSEQEMSAPGGTREPMTLGTGTLLLVEDDATVRSLTTHMLRQHGFLVVPARSGPQALALIGSGDARYTYDALISDVMMPGMDGAQLAARIRELAPELPVLFVTASSDEQLWVRGIDPASDTCLRKPYRAHDLVSRVNRLISRAKHRKSRT